ASNVNGVDIVIGAHSEDLVKQPFVVGRGDGARAYVLQAGHFARAIGRADLVVDLRTKRVRVARYRIVDVTAKLPIAEDVAELADRLEREAAPDAQRPIATLARPIPAG